MGRRLVALIGGMLGLSWYYLLARVLVGPSVFNPTSLNWLMQGDGAQHVLGWLFFRHEPWTLPLGSVPSFGYPVGTTVGFTDSIPWVAVVFKNLSPLLPVDFQYLGLWSGLCFFLRGAVGVKIVQEISPRPFIQLLGGAFFIFDFVHGQHALAAHWLILAIVWLHIRPCADQMTQHRILKVALGLCLLSAGIHPYLAVMVLALSLTLLCKLHWISHLLSTSDFFGWGLAHCMSVVAVFALFGYFGTGTSLGGGGFGHYSADLLALINPMGLSRFIPALPSGPGQYEGFGYVGGGVLVLTLLALAVIWGNLEVVRGCLRRWGWLGACCLLLATFALSSTVTIAGKPTLDLDTLYRPITKVIAPFRVSGRFIWPLHYLVITGALSVWIRTSRLSQNIITLVLIVAVLIQLVELNVPLLQLLQWDRKYPQRKQGDLLHVDEWHHATGLYEHMVLYPPQLFSGGDGVICNVQEYGPDYYIPLAYQAYKLRLTFNSGYFGRMDVKRAQAYCNELDRKIQKGEIDENTIYVVHISHWHLFKRMAPEVICGRIHEHIICVSAQRRNAFREFLISHEFSSTPLTLSLNRTDFQQGDTLVLTATLQPEDSLQQVECYIWLQRPDGTSVFLQSDGQLRTERGALLSDITLTAFNKELLRYTLTGEEPSGTYRWFGALTETGRSRPIGEIVQAPFRIGP